LHVGRAPGSEVVVEVEFNVPVGDWVPESTVCEDFGLSDEPVTLPTISPLSMLNIVVDPMVVVIVVEPLVMVERRGAVEMGTEDSTVIVDE
jgi:hypothetical protein